MAKVKIGAVSVEKRTKPFNDLLKRLIKATGNEYGAIAEDGLSSDITQWTDTGCLLWNMQISGDLNRGVPNGKVFGLAGPSGTMKTYACISLIGNFLSTNDNGHVFIFDSENAITQERLKERNVDLSRIAHFPVISLSDFKTQCYKLLKEINADPESKSARFMIVLDSLGNLPSSIEVGRAEKGSEAADMGSRSKDIRSIFRTITVMLGKNQIPMIVTNHSYADIKPFSHGQIMGGGGGLVFAADSIAMFTKAQVKDGDIRVGSIITSTLEKGRDAKEKTKAKMLLHYNHGLHKYYGLLDWAVKAGIVNEAGKGKYEVDGTKYSETDFYANAKAVFTEERLTKLNEYMRPFFVYGGVSERSHEAPVVDVDEEVNAEADE